MKKKSIFSINNIIYLEHFHSLKKLMNGFKLTNIKNYFLNINKIEFMDILKCNRKVSFFLQFHKSVNH